MALMREESPHIVISARGDCNEMVRFLKDSNLNVKRIVVVHWGGGSEQAFCEFPKADGFAPTGRNVDGL